MPQTCPQCQREAPDDADNCSNCGAALGAGTTAAQAAPTMGGGGASATAAPAAISGSSVPAYKFDAARWTMADRIAGVATVVLFICLFLPWFTVSVGVAGYSIGGSVNGLWHGWMYLTLIISILIVAYLVLALAGTGFPSARTSRT